MIYDLDYRFFFTTALIFLLTTSVNQIWAQDPKDETTGWIKVGLANMGLGPGTRHQGNVGLMFPLEVGEFGLGFNHLSKVGIGTKVFEGSINNRRYSQRILMGNVNSFFPLYLYMPLHLASPKPMNLLSGRKTKPIHKSAAAAFIGGSAWGIYNSYLHMGLFLMHTFSMDESDPISPFLLDPYAIAVRIGFFKAYEGTASSGWFIGVSLGSGAAFIAKK